MKFDPLDFISSASPTAPESDFETNYIFEEKQYQHELSKIHNDFSKSEITLNVNDAQNPIHILDLPHISSKPPASVLSLILQLFEWDTHYNFGSSDDNAASHFDSESYFVTRGISTNELQVSQKWLELHCPKLQSTDALKSVGDLRTQFPREFFQYITAIVSSSLSWLESAQRDKLWRLAGLRLAENCGRAAQPEITRKIVFNNCSYSVLLKEPSLTEDNLGLKTWGSSFSLSQRIIQTPRLVQYPILELGSGTGLVGITCGLLQNGKASEIYLTDLDVIVPNLRHNVDLNGLHDVCKVHALDWTNPASFDDVLNIKNNSNIFKTVILSDPIYSPEHVYLVAEMIKKYLSLESGSRVLLQLPQRPKYEEIREDLWALFKKDHVLKALVLKNEAFEDGADDFGHQRLIFKHWERE